MLDYILARVRDMALHASVAHVTLGGPATRRDVRALSTGYSFFYDRGAPIVNAHLVTPHLGAMLCWGCWSWDHKATA